MDEALYAQYLKRGALFLEIGPPHGIAQVLLAAAVAREALDALDDIEIDRAFAEMLNETEAEILVPVRPR